VATSLNGYATIVRVVQEVNLNRSKATNIASERAVLAGILQHGADAYIDISELVTTETFTDEVNQCIWKIAKSIYDEDLTAKIDLPLFLAESSKLGLGDFLSQPEPRKYFTSLLGLHIEEENVQTLAIQIRKLHVARTLQQAADKIVTALDSINGSEDITKIIALAENPIFEASLCLQSSTNNDVKHIGTGLLEYLQHVESNPSDIVGISTGLPHFDRGIGGGLRRKTVSVVGARIKTGKSALLDNVALNVANRGIPVINLDTEMSEVDHWNRMLANLSSVKIDEIETGKYASDKVKLRKVRDAAKQLGSIPYHYMSINGKTFEEVTSIIRRWLMRTVGYDEYGNLKDCVVIYDYLKLMSEGDMKDMQEWQKLGFQMSALHNFCVKYDVPCLTAIQLNRDGINKESTDIVAGSDRILWTLSNFSILKRKSPEEIAADGPEYGNLKLVTLLARHGRGMEDGDYINIKFQGDICKMEETFTHFQIQNGEAGLGQHDNGFVTDDGDDNDIPI
jgi:replicative DNA helicase